MVYLRKGEGCKYVCIHILKRQQNDRPQNKENVTYGRRKETEQRDRLDFSEDTLNYRFNFRTKSISYIIIKVKLIKKFKKQYLKIKNKMKQMELCIELMA